MAELTLVFILLLFAVGYVLNAWNARHRAQIDRAAALALDFAIDMAKRSACAREVIDAGPDKRYARRSGQVQLKESNDVGRSFAHRKRKATNKAKRGQGDRRDR